VTATWTALTDGAAGISSMVMPNTLLISPSDLFCTNPSDPFTNKEGTARKMTVTFVTVVMLVTFVT
jgi:hypothetical protein